MRSWFAPGRRAVEAAAPVRAVEATPDQLIASGAVIGSWARDPIDGDVGWKLAGSVGREVPYWTQEKSRAYSIAAYRINPMAKAIIDTYTSFCVGDSGLSVQVSNPKVKQIVDEFWSDPRNCLDMQDLLLRDLMLNGEQAWEIMQGPGSGVIRYSPFDPSWIVGVKLLNGNPLWPSDVVLGQNMTPGGEERPLSIVMVQDEDQLRDGQCIFRTPWKALITDRRGMPFMSAIVDQLDAYDTIVSNLIDRTALARYLVWDVTVNGDDAAVLNFINSRGGKHIPQSGSVEVHNEAVKWEPKTAPTGALEDSTAASTVLTEIAGGAGLSKHWLSEPEGTNRATSHSMAEPVRRRVGGVQKTWLWYMTDLCRLSVDRAVAAGRLPKMVQATDLRTGASYEIPASMTVTVTGPEIAAADAQVTAQVLLNLSTGLSNFAKAGVLSPAARDIAARKAWEQFVGVPYTADLDAPDTNPDDLATHIDDNKGASLGQPDGGPQPTPAPESRRADWGNGRGLTRSVARELITQRRG
ncbi:MAG: hypothetical protein AUG49_21425 [Catenulispora sp. 13_1_20CM_3_70_7]|nr:MAG: hypothetical protein AUG49_21425 [Catenulispora sp. 13_1_20CM_3_70_7]